MKDSVFKLNELQVSTIFILNFYLLNEIKNKKIKLIVKQIEKNLHSQAF